MVEDGAGETDDGFGWDADDSPADDDAAVSAGRDARTDGESGGRDVVVPLRLYKTVTVFSTLFAIVFVLAGFVLLDVATDRARAPLSEVEPVVAIAGLLAITAGAAVYAFSTRFRAGGMGTHKDDGGEADDNG